MPRTIVVTDSASSLTKEEQETYGIVVLPMLFYVDGTEYREGISISKETLFEALREEKQVSTTQIPLGELLETWQKLLETYDELVYIPLSGEISGGYETGVLLSRQFDGKVTVIDSRSVSLIEGAVAIEAAKLTQKGYSGSQIKEKLAEVIPENIIYVTVDSLKQLKKGGRVSGAAAWTGDLLQIKPVLRILDGPVEMYRKAHGVHKAKKVIMEEIHKAWELLSEKYGANRLKLYMAYGDNADAAEKWKAEMQQEFPDHPITMRSLPLNLCCHLGPGTIGAGISICLEN